MIAVKPTKLIFCEGDTDHVFLDRLIQFWKIQPFCIETSDGNGRFYEKFDAFSVKGKGFRPFSDMLVVADNDEDPAASFESVRGQIEKFFGKKHTPSKPLQKMPKAGQFPSITVMMMPGPDIKGHLERFLVSAAQSVNSSTTEHVNHFLSMAQADKWQNESRWHKAWLRSYLAIRANNPFVPLGHVFNRPANHELIPIDHPSFQPLVDFLKAF